MTLKWHKPPFVLNEIKLEVTWNCPLNCLHCSSASGYEKKGYVSSDSLKSIINQAASLHVKEIVFSGGEPLSYPYIIDAVRLSRENKIEPTVYTSGNARNATKTINDLASKYSPKFIFSMYSGDPTTHERISRKTGSLNRTLKSIKAAKENLSTTEIHFVPMAKNFKELPSVVDIALKLGISKVSVLRFVPHGRAAKRKSLALDLESSLEFAGIVQDQRKRIQIRAGSPFNSLLINDNPACCAAVDRLFINPDLDIFPCDAFKNIFPKDIGVQADMQNLREYSLKEVWDSSAYLKAVRDYLTTDFYVGCRKCHLLYQCLSGCLAQKAIKNNSLRKDKDSLCLRGVYK